MKTAIKPNHALADRVLLTVAETLSVLVERWRDEHEHEDIDDYRAPIVTSPGSSAASTSAPSTVPIRATRTTMGKPPRRPAAYVCSRCEYVEVYATRVEEDFVPRHCGVPMRSISAAKLRKLDARDPSMDCPKSFLLSGGAKR